MSAARKKAKYKQPVKSNVIIAVSNYIPDEDLSFSTSGISIQKHNIGGSSSSSGMSSSSGLSVYRYSHQEYFFEKQNWISEYGDCHNIKSITPSKREIRTYSLSCKLERIEGCDLNVLRDRIKNFLICFDFIQTPSLNIAITEYDFLPTLYVVYRANEHDGEALREELKHGIEQVIKNFTQESFKKKSSGIYPFVSPAKEEFKNNGKRLTRYSGMTLKQRVNFQIKRTKVKRSLWKNITNLFKKEKVRRKLKITSR